jgi:hypothetical protein
MRIEWRNGDGGRRWECWALLVCLLACPRRRLLCIWFQWASVGLGFADAIVASRTVASRVRVQQSPSFLLFVQGLSPVKQSPHPSSFSNDSSLINLNPLGRISHPPLTTHHTANTTLLTYEASHRIGSPSQHVCLSLLRISLSLHLTSRPAGRDDPIRRGGVCVHGV